MIPNRNEIYGNKRRKMRRKQVKNQSNTSENKTRTIKQEVNERQRNKESWPGSTETGRNDKEEQGIMF